MLGQDMMTRSERVLRRAGFAVATLSGALALFDPILDDLDFILQKRSECSIKAFGLMPCLGVGSVWIEFQRMAKGCQSFVETVLVLEESQRRRSMGQTS